MKLHKFRESKASDYISITTGYDYTEDIDLNVQGEVKAFIDSIFDDEDTKLYMYKMLAMSLDGTISFETLDIWSGKGRNGKGVLDTLIQHTFGRYYAEIDISYFTQMSKKSNEASPEMADKRGVRLLMSSEPESEETIKVKTLKKITGGDLISARKLFQDNSSFKPQFTLFLQTNDIPNLSKLDCAVQERLNILNFPFVFKSIPKNPNEKLIDVTLKDKISNNMKWHQQFMLLLLDIHKKHVLGITKKFDIPISIANRTKEYIDENNPVGAWLNEFYEITDKKTDVMSKREAHDAFVLDTGRKININSFSALMKYNNINEKTLNGVKMWYGLKKIELDEVEDDMF